MISLLRPALTLFLVLSLLTGLAYPAGITLIAQIGWPAEAEGSLVRVGDRVVGSSLIGQSFTGPGYFWGRPSATGPQPYNAVASSGSNLGPLNPALVAAVRARVQVLRESGVGGDVPADLVTSSASGLDPHLSVAAARLQVDRVAQARGLPAERVRALVDQAVQGRQWGLFGEPRVNVLLLNLALDRAGS